VIDHASVPGDDEIFAWIAEVFAQGVRRPGYPADRWAEQWCQDRFRALGLEDVRAEPLTATSWEADSWTVVAIAGEEERLLDCFPLPYAAPVEDLDVELVRFDPGDPAAVAGRGSFEEVALLSVPADFFLTGGSAPADLAGRVVDRDGSLGEQHLLPFGPHFQEVLEPSIEAGAALFVGALTGYPGGGSSYYVPYDGIPRPIPGVWVGDADGAWLSARLAEGPVRVRASVRCAAREVETFNIVGELPGADDEVVIIGSHHDGPWASAVEDGSGIALVLAQAAYWAAQPAEARPHRLRFLLQGGHMAGGAGLHAYIDQHRAELDRVVLELHLEHAALECVDDPDGPQGALLDVGRPVPRWWFVSRIPSLEAAVSDALHAEDLWRSMILAPDAIGPQPPTDGGHYHLEGVPIVDFLAAPWYLFDEADTLDRIDRTNLAALTRAAIRIVVSTAGRSAASMRAEAVPATPPAG
jgi:hypothetical protein